MADADLHEQIDSLAREEHELLTARGHGDVSPEQLTRLKEIELALDRTWDLLRQRDARRNAGLDPSTAQERPAGEVEGYLQ
jgi:hypothetical protein